MKSGRVCHLIWGCLRGRSKNCLTDLPHPTFKDQKAFAKEIFHEISIFTLVDMHLRKALPKRFFLKKKSFCVVMEILRAGSAKKPNPGKLGYFFGGK